MRTAFLKIAIAALSLVILARVSQASVMENYAVRDWNIGAYSNDDTSRFSHCAMSATYKNGVMLIFIVDRERNWFMALANDRWNLTEGQQYNFSIELDGTRGGKWFGVAASPQVLRIPLAESAALFEQFSAAQTLTIAAASQSFRFDLSNSRVALQAVMACTNRYIAREATPANPFEAHKSSPSTPASRIEALYAEGTAVMSKMLAEIGSTGHTLVPVETGKVKFGNDHAVWIGNGTAGSVRIYADAISADGLAAELASASGKECDGKFAAAKTATSTAVKVTALCLSEPGRSYSGQFIIVPRQAGGLYLFQIFTTAQSAEAATTVVRYGDLMLASAKSRPAETKRG